MLIRRYRKRVNPDRGKSTLDTVNACASDYKKTTIGESENPALTMKFSFALVLMIFSLCVKAESLDSQIPIPGTVTISGEKYQYRLETLRGSWTDYLAKMQAALAEGETPEKEKVQVSRRAAWLRALASCVVSAGVLVKESNEVEDLFRQTVMLLKDDPVPPDIQFPGQLLANMTATAFSSTRTGGLGAAIPPTLEQLSEPQQFTFSEYVERARRLIEERNSPKKSLPSE